MEELRSYILSVTAAAILCVLVTTLVGKGSNIGSLLKLITGMILTAVILRPMVSIGDINLHRYLEQLNDKAASAVDQGTAASQTALRTGILENLEAYILDKAAKHGLVLDVSVTLDEASMAPVGVVISGAVSPFAKMELQAILEEDLGIPQEAQIWK